MSRRRTWWRLLRVFEDLAHAHEPCVAVNSLNSLPPRLSPMTSFASIRRYWMPAAMLSLCLRSTASRMYSRALATASAQMPCNWAATSCGTLTLQYGSSVDCADASSVCRISGADVPRKCSAMLCRFVSAPGRRSSSMDETLKDSASASVLRGGVWERSRWRWWASRSRLWSYQHRTRRVRGISLRAWAALALGATWLPAPCRVSAQVQTRLSCQ